MHVYLLPLEIILTAAVARCSCKSHGNVVSLSWLTLPSAACVGACLCMCVCLCEVAVPARCIGHIMPVMACKRLQVTVAVMAIVAPSPVVVVVFVSAVLAAYFILLIKICAYINCLL